MQLSVPNVGDVIHYSYLWAREAAQGATEGHKERPAVVVAAVARTEDATLVAVLPITHASPTNDTVAVPLPDATTRRLGLDENPHWIVASEYNWFIWPGFDVRPVPRKSPATYLYGALPNALMAKVRDAIAEAREDKAFRAVNRGEE